MTPGRKLGAHFHKLLEANNWGDIEPFWIEQAVQDPSEDDFEGMEEWERSGILQLRDFFEEMAKAVAEDCAQVCEKFGDFEDRPEAEAFATVIREAYNPKPELKFKR